MQPKSGVSLFSLCSASLLLSLSVFAEQQSATLLNRDTSMPGQLSLQFSQSSHFSQARLVHDTVMGGRSAGFLSALESSSGLRFVGDLSLENNGGFASVEFTLAQALPAQQFKLLKLDMLGDSRIYQLRLKTPYIPQGVAYVAQFQSQPQQQLYLFEPAQFYGQFRGRRVSGLPPLRFSDVSLISVMLADSRPGPFAIELYSISFSALQSI